jgi:hypothetical protein
MAVYTITYECDECGERHLTASRVQFLDANLDGQPISVVYAGHTLSPNIKVMQEPNKLHCPNMNQATSQPDLDKIFLAAATP